MGRGGGAGWQRSASSCKPTQLSSLQPQMATVRSYSQENLTRFFLALSLRTASVQGGAWGRGRKFPRTACLGKSHRSLA